jgi:hypothetical protein
MTLLIFICALNLAKLETRCLKASTIACSFYALWFWRQSHAFRDSGMQRTKSPCFFLLLPFGGFGSSELRSLWRRTNNWSPVLVFCLYWIFWQVPGPRPLLIFTKAPFLELEHDCENLLATILIFLAIQFLHSFPYSPSLSAYFLLNN